MRRSAARLDHSTQHVTNPAVFRVRTAAGDGHVTLAWDYPGSTLLEVRILRSERAFAGLPEDADQGRATGQDLVYDDVSGSFRDSSVRDGITYFYTVFARPAGGEWRRWGEYRLRAGATPAGRRLGMRRVAGAVRDLLARGLRRALPVALLALCLAAAAAGPAAADDPIPALDNATQRVRGIAEANGQVAAVLAGTGAEAVVTAWDGLPGTPAGATVIYSWPAAQRRSVAAVWPLLASGADSVPAAPFVTLRHRVRIDDLTALRVDVLPGQMRVLQILPQDGQTEFKLREETRAPLAWFPWFTGRPWLLAPVFLAVAGVVIARAWRRSRAWNRRLPSMTRHDRQFIGRLAVIVFLVAGLALQVYEAWYAARAPALDPGGLRIGDLATLPLLLFPPALFIAGLALELTPFPHRVAWGLVAVLAGAATAYSLATAMTTTATTLNLTNFILLGVLALLAGPRAFSAGRMGWSRHNMPRYA